MKKIACAGSDSGTVLLETVLVMPILLSFFIGIWQLALIWQARQVVAYAAFAAARAGMVETATAAPAAARNAAVQVCKLIGMPIFENRKTDGALTELTYDPVTKTYTYSIANLKTPDPAADYEVPWLGVIMGSRDVAEQVVSVTYAEVSNETCSATVTFKYPLIYSRLPAYCCYFIKFPTLNTSAKPWTYVGNITREVPAELVPFYDRVEGDITIVETAVLSKPFTVMD